MKHVSGLKKTLIASAVAVGMMAPHFAVAEVSGSLGISNMYFWRGQDISAGRPAVSGSLDYTHQTGLYAGIWGSSEGPADEGFSGSTEYDLYVGYGGAVGDFSYDISYIHYIYPSNNDFDLEEVIASVGFAGLTATGYIGVGEAGHGDDAVDNENNYFTLDYSYDKYGILVGTWDFDADDTNYTHLDLSYSLTDELSFTVSKIVDADEGSSFDDGDDPLFVVSYSFAI